MPFVTSSRTQHSPLRPCCRVVGSVLVIVFLYYSTGTPQAPGYRTARGLVQQGTPLVRRNLSHAFDQNNVKQTLGTLSRTQSILRTGATGAALYLATYAIRLTL